MAPTFWQKAVGPMSKALVAEMKRFTREHRGQKVTRVVLTANGKNGKTAMAVDIQGGKGGWEPTAFRYPEFAWLDQHPAWDPLTAQMALGAAEDAAPFLEAVTITLLVLHGEGVTDELSLDEGFEFLTRGTGETEDAARARSEATKAALFESDEDES